MLLGNYSVYNKLAVKYLGATSQCDRSNWNTPGAMRNIYYGDCSAFSTDTAIVVTTHPLFIYGDQVGYVPPYSWMISQKAGGMAMRVFDTSGTLTSNLIPQQPTSAAFTGSGSLSATIIGYGNLICALTGSSTLTAAITATGNITLSATGSGTITADIKGNGNVTLAMTGSGTLNATASLFLNAICNMTGSGTLSANASLLVSMICAMTGGATMTANITGQLHPTCSITGSGNLAADITAFGNMITSLTGTGTLTSGIHALADMSIDIVVTGTGLTTANVGNAIWGALAAEFNDPNTMGHIMNSLGSGTDPWSTDLPGTYTGDQAGALLLAYLKKIKALSAANL